MTNKDWLTIPYTKVLDIYGGWSSLGAKNIDFFLAILIFPQEQDAISRFLSCWVKIQITWAAIDRKLGEWQLAAFLDL